MRPGHVWTPWTELETKALLEAVCEYGLGQWAVILKDATYGPILGNRSNVDLKDKWRVMERARLRAGQPSLLQLYPNLQNCSKSRSKRSASSSATAVPAVVPSTLARNAGAVAVVATAIDDKDDPLRPITDANKLSIDEREDPLASNAPRKGHDSSQRTKRKAGRST